MRSLIYLPRPPSTASSPGPPNRRFDTVAMGRSTYELVLKRNPLVIGAGIPLDGPFVPTTFEPVSTRTFDGGVVMETYRRVSAPA